jgi:hypothetical protein
VANVPDQPMPQPLARAHAWARRQPWLGRFTLMNRLLLAMAFLPTGLVKASGQRFTSLPVDNPVGFFFEAMYQTGPFWVFIGLMQMSAAVLLLIPATATVGAVLFFPIVLSIFLITWGVGFQGTVWVTSGMLLAATYLVCWDGDRVWRAGATLVGSRPSGGLLAGAGRVERAGWALGGAVGVALLLVVRGFLPSAWMGELIVAGVTALILVIVGGAATLLRRPTDPSMGRAAPRP